MLQHNKPKQSRTSKGKTKTGCITCKKRHVKCDEARPHCTNCLKTRGQCEGYVVRPKNKLPGQLCWDSRRSVHEASSNPLLLLDPDILNPQDATGTLYFQEFIFLVQGPWTTAVSNGDLWTRTLPQLARNNDTLRSAAMAIGALSIWHRQSRCKSLRNVSVPSSSTAVEHVHYFQAVAYYCRSLKLHSQQLSSRSMIFLSVLLLLFEMLRGNRKAALDHVNHGLALLLTFLTDGGTNCEMENFAPNPKPLLGAVVDIFIHLTTHSRAMLRGRIGQGPALPNLTKGLKARQQTLGSFITHLGRLQHSTTTNDCIPAVFSELTEFEEHWVAVRRRHDTMTVIMLEVLQASAVSGTIKEGLVQSFYTDLLGNSRIREFCNTSIKSVEDLDAAFVPLFNKLIMGDAKSVSYLKAIHLRLQLLGVYLFEDPPQFLDIESLQLRTPKFREYLSLAGVAICAARQEIINPAHQVSLQCGLSWNLLIISFFCRDPLARDEAIGMLRDYPGQDGLWNIRGLHALALKNRELEQANMSEGTPMEQWRRLLRREFVFEDSSDRVLFRFLEKDEVLEEWKLVEEVTNIKIQAPEVHWKRQQLTGSGGLLMAELYHN